VFIYLYITVKNITVIICNKLEVKFFI